MNFPKPFKRHTHDRLDPSHGRRVHKHWRYVGVRKRLYEKMAIVLLMKDNDTHVIAQFDDMTQPEAFGWHAFKREEFTDEY